MIHLSEIQWDPVELLKPLGTRNLIRYKGRSSTENPFTDIAKVKIFDDIVYVVRSTFVQDFVIPSTMY